jgi:hypothetical protein
MSFAGAVRIYLVARPPQAARRREPEALAPIVEGRWASWAQREQARARAATAALRVLMDIDSLTDVRCRLPDGTVGRVAIVMDGGGPTRVCQVARLQRVRG